MKRLLWPFVLCLILSGCFLPQKPTESERVPTIGPDVMEYGGERYRLREDLTTILVLGLDSFDHTLDSMAYTNHMQSDFLLLLVVDEAANTCVPLHINRDTMTQIRRLGVAGGQAGSFLGQIALAHTYGSGGSDSSLNAVRAVSKLFGDVPVDHYITMTMDAVSVINDRLGGVTITVLDDFSNVDPTLIQGEEVTLMGQQALTYVRARSGMADSSNLRRMERQRQYLEAFQQKLLQTYAQDSSFLSKIMMELGGDVTSDCTMNGLEALMTTLSQCTMEPIRDLKGEAKVGAEFMEFYPDTEDLQKTIVELFYEKKP